MMILRLFLLILMLSDVKAVSGPNGSNRLVVVEEAYIKWVKQMGSLSLKKKKKKKPDSNNKFKACLRVKVNKNPQKGDFITVQDAINSLPQVNKCRVVVFISSGTYREKVEIPASKAYITLKGAGADKTVIEWGDTADKRGPNGHPLGTFGSATFAINSPYFIANNITFKNKAGKSGSGKVGKQAVALRISGDTAAFRGCKFVGGQDTLYDHMGRHYFKDCYIEGSVDFVFGNGLSLYRDCHLHAISSSYGAVTAQKRESYMEETGFSFVNCKVTGSGALYLGRAWGSFSRVVFSYTYMDDIITPKGWYDWGDRNRDMTVYFGQYKCYGPGSNFGGRVAWSRELTQQEAKPFIGLDFIDGYKWLFHNKH